MPVKTVRELVRRLKQEGVQVKRHHRGRIVLVRRSHPDRFCVLPNAPGAAGISRRVVEVIAKNLGIDPSPYV